MKQGGFQKKFRALIRLLDEDDPQILSVVTAELIANRDQVSPMLHEAINTSDSLVRVRIKEILDEIESLNLKEQIESLRQYLKTEDFSLERALHLVGRIFYPKADFVALQDGLSEMAIGLKDRLSSIYQPAEVIDTVNKFFLNEVGLKGNVENYHELDNNIIYRVLERKKGIPVSLCTVYILVGRRLNLPIFGVGAPAHFMIKFLFDRTEIFVDVFNNGVVMLRSEAEQFIRSMGFEPEERHLMAVNDYQILARTCRNISRSLELKGDSYKANLFMGISLEIEKMVQV
ncbi:MAG: transglutaminase-like domain-containing protein [Candidatus Kryptoniota bacterium]